LRLAGKLKLPFFETVEKRSHIVSTRSDFTIVPFGEFLGDNANDNDLPWAVFVGNETNTKSFLIDDMTVGDAYLLIQTYKVGVPSHKIFINSRELKGFNIPPHDGWQTWMVVITEPILKRGINTIKVVRDARTDDDFAIGNITVHWREYRDR
jgi:hypothetical protein